MDGRSRIFASFFKDEDEPDVHHPFLSARFGDSQTSCDSARNMGHANPNILALGILLIEIFNERPIERWITRKERCNPSTTVWMAADRVVKKMDQSPSREAIEACLDLHWIPAGRSAELEDSEVRKGLFENIIAPLMQEIKWLSVDSAA
jgi:hypothetical protein